ncbi:MAG TPA: acetyl-CoA C-acyltransferase [Longimicrobiales bacterium]|nr:acetyl-CoA C-acyltransferase [Longimicrobiales bacterium]
MSRQAYIIDAVRTPVGRHGGALARVRPDDLAAVPLRALVARTGIDPTAIEDVLLGCANQAGEDNRNVARMASLLAGYPIEVAGQTINRLCGSGLQAVNSAQQAIAADAGDVFVAGGVESMSRAPYVMLKPEEGFARGAPAVADTVLGWRFTNPLFPKNYTIALGETAEVVAERCGVTREAQDEFALRSQQKAAAALEACRFGAELTPVEIAQRRGDPVIVDRDEHPRPDTTLEALTKLRPAFRKDGTVTAGNSSGLNDGAAALLVVSESASKSLGLEPRARIVATAVAGVEPDAMGMGPVPATRKALKRAGVRSADLKLVEINEAFAAQSIPCVEQLDLDPEIVNVNGGAIALGHPLGASGARILTTLVHELQRRGGGYGVATMCIGVGQGIATVVEVY